MNTFQNACLFLIAFSMLLSCAKKEKNLDTVLPETITYVQQQLKQTDANSTDSTRYPRSTKEDGSWHFQPSWNWTSGFYPGCLWLTYELTQDESFAELAQKWTAGIEKEKENRGTHDLGFMIFCSFGNGYRLQPNEAYKHIIFDATESLASRYSPVVGCIKSWDVENWGNWTPDFEDEYVVIIDNMMNLEMMFWAAKNGGKQEWYDMAVSHAEKTMQNHIREDGSTFHVVNYHAKTGEVGKQRTRQGYADASTWSRGQAWGIYGFTMTYRETKDARFLQTAHRLADYFIAQLPEDFVPHWDFQAPADPIKERDSSAGAIACSALFELSELTTEPALKKKYRSVAEKMLYSLATNYLTKGTNDAGILNQAVGSKPENSEVNVNLIYGDYYFIEAINRYRSLK